MQVRTELWNIRTHHHQWVGRADLLIHSDGRAEGTISFPADPNSLSDKFDGRVTDQSIQLTRHLSGPNAGKTQIYTGKYNANRSSAQGTISGTGGGPGADWEASIQLE